MTEVVKEMRAVSFWSYGLFDKCPKQFEYVIIKNIPTPRTISEPNTVMGAIVHNAMEMFVKGEASTLDHAFHMGVASVASRAPADVIKRMLPKSRKGIDWIWKSLKPFQDRGAKFYPEITLKSSAAPVLELGLTIKGRIDLVIEEGDHCRIYDYKGVRKVQSLTNEQLWFYSALVLEKFKKPLKEVGYLWYSEQMVRVVKLQEFTQTRVLDKLRELKESVIKSVFPAKIGRHCDWCAAKDQCSEYKEFKGAFTV